MTQLCSNFPDHKLSVKASKKHKEGAAYCRKTFLHWLCFMHSNQVLLTWAIAITLISTRQSSEELNYAPTWLSKQSLQSHTYTISYDSKCPCVYNAHSPLISNIRSIFVESPNVRKITHLSMANLFLLNWMEIQGFPSANLPTPFRGKGPGV